MVMRLTTICVPQVLLHHGNNDPNWDRADIARWDQHVYLRSTYTITIAI